MLADAALNARQCIREASEPARLAYLPHALPLRVVAVLQTSGGIAADRLDVGARIGGVEHVLISRRDGERGEPPLLGRGHHCAVRFAVAEAAAMPLPANGQFGRADIFQAEALDEFCGRGRKPGLIGRRAIGLLF